jgi:hypothetical protein
MRRGNGGSGPESGPIIVGLGPSGRIVALFFFSTFYFFSMYWIWDDCVCVESKCVVVKSL